MGFRWKLTLRHTLKTLPHLSEWNWRIEVRYKLKGLLWLLRSHLKTWKSSDSEEVDSKASLLKGIMKWAATLGFSSRCLEFRSKESFLCSRQIWNCISLVWYSSYNISQNRSFELWLLEAHLILTTYINTKAKIKLTRRLFSLASSFVSRNSERSNLP